MRSRKSDKAKQKRYKEGNPYTMPRDFGSTGVTERQQDDEGKEQVLFSTLESQFDLIFYYTTKLLKCENNAPILPISRTQIICKEQSITHPKNEKGEDVVMTTDFLLTIEIDGKVFKLGVSIKYSSDLDKRTLEKFEAERIARQKEGRIWVLLTERQMDKVVLRNIKFISDFKIQPDDYHAKVLEEFTSVRTKSISLTDFAESFAKKFNVQKNVCIRSFYHLIATKKVRFDFSRELNSKMTMSDFILDNKKT